MDKIYNYIRTKDTITLPSYNILHFDAELKTKTLVGGIISLCIKCYVFYIGFKNFIKMVTYDDPYIVQIENGMSLELDNEMVWVADVSKPVIAVYDNQQNPISLD